MYICLFVCFCLLLLVIKDLVNISSVFIQYFNKKTDQYDSLYTLRVKGVKSLLFFTIN